jgi:purine nucleosidase
MTEHIILDCDPGRDDAFAIALAIASPDEVNMLGITTAAGNVPLELTQRNARIICALCDRAHIPVFAGADRPLKRDPVFATEHHGETGLHGIEIFEPTEPVQDLGAMDYILGSLANWEPGTITIVATGPLTNLAHAIEADAETFRRVKQIVIMGGAQRAGGNITPAAEFNIYADPHAAAVVLASGCPLVMFGLDVTHQVLAGHGEADSLSRHGGPVSQALAGMVLPIDDNGAGTTQSPLHDPCTIAWLIEPGLFHTKMVNMEVECESPLTMGMTVVDMRGTSGRDTNVLWAHDVDGPAVVDLIISRIQAL